MIAIYDFCSLTLLSLELYVLCSFFLSFFLFILYLQKIYTIIFYFFKYFQQKTTIFLFQLFSYEIIYISVHSMGKRVVLLSKQNKLLYCTEISFFFRSIFSTISNIHICTGYANTIDWVVHCSIFKPWSCKSMAMLSFIQR